jgi:hypothetical protein
LHISYWCRNRKLEAEIEVDVLELALNELSLHPQDVWDTYSPLFVRRLKELGLLTRAAPSKEEYKAVILDRTDSWY